MADDLEGRGQDQETVEPGTEERNSEAQETGQVQGEEVLTLTAKDLQKRIDRAVTKALKTRTANLQRELEEARAQLEEYRRKAEEEDLSVIAKLEVRERELNAAKEQVKKAQKSYEGLVAEIGALVDAELEVLSEEDRKVVEQAFPEDAPPLLKLKVIRALKNAGKLASATDKPKPENVGTRTRFAGGGGEAGATSPMQKLMALGREIAKLGQGQEESYVPPAWEGR